MNATQLGFGTALVTPPPADFNPMGLHQWCTAHGIEDRGSSFVTMYERGDFTLTYGKTSEMYEICVWVPSVKVDGVWVDAHSKVLASHADRNAGLMDLASR